MLNGTQKYEGDEEEDCEEVEIRLPKRYEKDRVEVRRYIYRQHETADFIYVLVP